MMMITMKVEEKDLGDYRDFVERRSKFSEMEPIGTCRAYQGVLDQSYDVFIDTAGIHPWIDIIRQECRLFGLNPRPVIELWETDCTWWPTHYRGLK